MDRAKERYLTIAAEYAGTGIEAGILLALAELAAQDGDVETWRSRTEEVIAKFPGSVYAFGAQISLLNIDGYAAGGSQGRQDAYNQFAQELGGPSFDAVTTDSLSPSDITSVLQLHFEKKMALRDLYTACYYHQAHLGDYDKAIRVAIFGRRALDFGAKSRNGFLEELAHALIQTGRDRARDIGARHSTPIIRALQPAPGATVPPDSIIEFETTTGPYFNGQIDIPSLQVELDGVDITEAVLFDVEYDFELEEDRDFEVLKPSFSVPPAPGLHTVTVRIDSIKGWNESSPSMPRSAEQTWSFTVQEEEPPSGEEVVPAIQDTILSERHQHQNDGAIPLLTLEKIQGKATRSMVGFDLTDIDLNGLSRATLVLTIGPNEHVDGWGNGRTISAQVINTAWHEGNGWNFGLKKKDQIPGSGSGATWFSPIDEDISNDSSNSVVNWAGAANSVFPPTAPTVVITNHQSREVAFDVTTDVLNGADHGWLVTKDQENVGSKISFYSREGAAAAGDTGLAPRLILEFGEVASSEPNPDSLLAHVGFGAVGTKLRLTSSGSEIRSTKEILQENPIAALAAEQLLSEATRANPVLNLTTRVAYRSWLAEGVQIAVSPFWAT